MKYDASWQPEYLTGWTDGLAARLPAKKNDRTFRGNYVFNNIRVSWTSGIERRVAYSIMAMPDVVELHSQLEVEYADVDGVLKKHFLDYYYITTAGWRVGVTVKDEARRNAITEHMKFILPRLVDHPVDEIVVKTDLDCTYGVFRNSASIITARKFFDPVEVNELMSVVGRLTGTFRLGQLYRSCRHPADRRSAIFNLLEHGVLVALNPYRGIDELSELRRGDGEIPRRLIDGEGA